LQILETKIIPFLQKRGIEIIISFVYLTEKQSLSFNAFPNTLSNHSDISRLILFLISIKRHLPIQNKKTIFAAWKNCVAATG